MSQTLADLIVIFGGTGDLAQRMLFPSLYFLDADGFLVPEFRIVAAARAELSREAFTAQVREAIDRRAEVPVDEAVWARFAARLDYVGVDATTAAGAETLKAVVGPAKAPIFFLAVSPSLYGRICRALGGSGLAGPHSRIVLEKPIGRDLHSSRAINDAVGEVFRAGGDEALVLLPEALLRVARRIQLLPVVRDLDEAVAQVLLKALRGRLREAAVGPGRAPEAQHEGREEVVRRVVRKGPALVEL